MNGLILLTCRDCNVTNDDVALLHRLDVTCSCCGDSPCKILVKMAVLRSEAEVMDDIIDIGELAT